MKQEDPDYNAPIERPKRKAKAAKKVSGPNAIAGKPKKLRGGTELSNEQFDDDVSRIRELSFWRSDLFHFKQCKQRTTFQTARVWEFFKKIACEGQVFKNKDHLQREVVDRMNAMVAQGELYRLKDTDKYVKIVCVPGCMWDTWFNVKNNPGNYRSDLKFFRCIQQNHDPDAHQKSFERY